MYFLEHENSGHGSETESTIHRGEGGGSAGLVTAGALGLGVGAGNAGVDELALAEELALDELLILERLVGAALRGHVLGRLEVEGASDVVELGSLDIGHVAAHVEGTTDALKFGEASSILESGVVGDLQVVADLGQERERKVAELVVSNKGKGLADLSQVGCGERLKAVLVETKGAVELGKGRKQDASAGTEGQVGGPDQVGQLNVDSLVVVGEVERVGDVAQLHLYLVDVAVVGDLEGLGHLDVDTFEGAESGVLDIDVVGLLDRRGETNVLEVGKSVPLDGLDLLQHGEINRVEAGKSVQVHLAVELRKRASTNALDVGVGRGDKVSVQDLDATDGDVVGGASGNGNATREGRARGQTSRVALVLDGGGRGDSAGRSCCGHVSIPLGSDWEYNGTQNVPEAEPAAASAGRTIFMIEGIVTVVEADC